MMSYDVTVTHADVTRQLGYQYFREVRYLVNSLSFYLSFYHFICLLLGYFFRWSFGVLCWEIESAGRITVDSPSVYEGARSVRKNRRQILCRTDLANEVNRTFIIWVLVHFLLCLQRCVRLQMLPFTLPLSFLVSLHVYTRQAFICLAYR